MPDHLLSWAQPPTPIRPGFPAFRDHAGELEQAIAAARQVLADLPELKAVTVIEHGSNRVVANVYRRRDGDLEVVRR